MALIAASVLIPGDYLAINTNLSTDALTAMGFSPSRIAELSQLVEIDVAGRPGGAVSLGSRHGLDFCSAAWHVGIDGLLVSIRTAVRGLIHLDDDRYGDTGGALLIQEMAGRVYVAVSADKLVARRAAEQWRCRRGLGLLNRDGEHFDDLADVRCSESVAGNTGALHRDDGVDQDVEIEPICG